VAAQRRDREPRGRVRRSAVSARVRVAVLTAAAFVLAAAALPAGAAPGGPTAHIGNVSVSNATPAPGAGIDVSSQGWRPGGRVVIALAGKDLMRTTADEHGAVHARVVIPSDESPRFDVLSVTGAAASGVPQEIVTGLSVVAERRVHSPTRPWGLVFVLAAGAALLMLASRRVERVGRARRAPAG
jgi:hypothetical protein